MNLFQFCFLVFLSLFQSFGTNGKVNALDTALYVSTTADDEISATPTAPDWLAVVPFFSESVEEKDEEVHTGDDVADSSFFPLLKREPLFGLVPFLMSGSDTAFALITPLFLLFQVFRN